MGYSDGFNSVAQLFTLQNDRNRLKESRRQFDLEYAHNQEGFNTANEQFTTQHDGVMQRHADKITSSEKMLNSRFVHAKDMQNDLFTEEERIRQAIITETEANREKVAGLLVRASKYNDYTPERVLPDGRIVMINKDSGNFSVYNPETDKIKAVTEPKLVDSLQRYLANVPQLPKVDSPTPTPQLPKVDSPTASNSELEQISPTVTYTRNFDVADSPARATYNQVAPLLRNFDVADSPARTTYNYDNGRHTESNEQIGSANLSYVNPNLNPRNFDVANSPARATYNQAAPSRNFDVADSPARATYNYDNGLHTESNDQIGSANLSYVNPNLNPRNFDVADSPARATYNYDNGLHTESNEQIGSANLSYVNPEINKRTLAAGTPRATYNTANGIGVKKTSRKLTTPTEYENEEEEIVESQLDPLNPESDVPQVNSGATPYDATAHTVSRPTNDQYYSRKVIDATTEGLSDAYDFAKKIVTWPWQDYTAPQEEAAKTPTEAPTKQGTDINVTPRYTTKPLNKIFQPEDPQKMAWRDRKRNVDAQIAVHLGEYDPYFAKYDPSNMSNDGIKTRSTIAKQSAETDKIYAELQQGIQDAYKVSNKDASALLKASTSYIHDSVGNVYQGKNATADRNHFSQQFVTAFTARFGIQSLNDHSPEMRNLKTNLSRSAANIFKHTTGITVQQSLSTALAGAKFKLNGNNEDHLEVLGTVAQMKQQIARGMVTLPDQYRERLLVELERADGATSFRDYMSIIRGVNMAVKKQHKNGGSY